MKKLIILLLVIITSCQTANIKNEDYKVSSSITELGSIGIAKTKLNRENNFSTRSFPVLKNKVRLSVEILPFTKEITDVYNDKIGQAQTKMTYVDSLPKKPEYVSVSLLDFSGYAQELNADYNKEINTFLRDTKEAMVISGVAMTLSEEDMAKIRIADAFYLNNNQHKKYTLALYKNGKQSDTIDLQSGVVLAYQLSKFCWAVNNRHQWYIGDIISKNESCKGNTKKAIEEKEETNLFKM